MNNFKYNRNRPFLVVTNFYDSKSKQLMESIQLVDSVKTKHLTEASVIIDILPRSLVKNRFTEYDKSKLISHFLEKYKDDVANGIMVWVKKIGQDKNKADELIAALEKEITVDENEI